MCMNNALYYALAWPFIGFGAIAEFIVWGGSSDTRQTTQQKQPNPTGYWMGRATEAESRFRDLDYKSRQKIKELENKLLEELHKKH
jgi:hypothetical protein